MNRTVAFALLSTCFAAGSAYADDITVDPHPFTSTLTRAQVKEELQQFHQSGVNPWADAYNLAPQPRGTSSTRAEVKAGYLASREEVAAFNGEDSGSAYMRRMAAAGTHPATRTLAASE